MKYQPAHGHGAASCKRLWGASVLAMGLAAGAPALAQQAPSEGPVQVASSVTTGLEAVTVLARRRAENAQDVPIAITHMGSEELARDNTDFITKLSQRALSITTFWANPRQVLVGLRGIGANAGNNDGLDPSVGVFIDGVYLGRTGQLGFSGAFEDIASLQILRGPQGTLFGKNTTAGAILVASNPPTFAPEFKGELILGDDNLRTVRAAVSGPIIAEKLAARLSVYDNKRDGYFSNPTRNETLNGLNNRGFRAQLLWRPTDDVSVRLIGAHDEIAQAPLPFTYLGDGPTRAGGVSYSRRLSALGYTPVADPFSYRVYQDARLYSEAQSNALSAEVNWTLGGGYRFTSISAYRDYAFVPHNDVDITPLPIQYDGGVANDLTQYSQEFRLASPDGQAMFGRKIDWVVGAYHFQQDLIATSRQLWGPLQYYFVTPPAGTTPASFDGLAYGYDAEGKIKSYALFGQATWRLSDRWELTGGLRQTWETKSAHTNSFIINRAGLTAAQVAATFSQTFGVSQGTVDSDNLSFLASVAYKISPDVMVYGSFSRGQKSAAANIGVFSPAQIAAGATTIVPGEEADSLEAGFKGAFLRRSARLNVAVFDTKVSNYQTTIQAVDYRDMANPRAVSFLGTIGGLRSRGAEVEAAWLPPFARGLKVTLGVSYVRATYEDFHNAPCPAERAAQIASAAICLYDASGQRVDQIPEWNVDVSAEYERQLTDRVQAYGVVQVAYKSDNYLAASGSRYGHVDAYSITNLRLGARVGDRLDLSAWVNNAFEEKYFVNAITASVNGPVRGLLGDPRSLGISLKVKY